MPDTFSVEPLYEDQQTGRLGIDESGRGFRTMEEKSPGPSLTGPVPHYGSIGGQQGNSQSLGGTGILGTKRPVQPMQDNSPEGLMAQARQMEDYFLSQSNDMSTAVDPTLIRDGRAEDGPPDWLNRYMDNDAPIDKLPTQQYRMEQDAIRQLIADR